MDNSKAKISVIMACYNCENTLNKSIDSIINQTYTNWIMICCDDGSNDRTYDILLEYKNKYPSKFIIIKNDENKQLPYSLNHCLKYVDTKYVARMDADDWALPTRFEKQINFLEKNSNFDLVGTNISIFDGEKIVSSMKIKDEPQIIDCLMRSPYLHATIMCHKYVYDKLNGYSLDPNLLRVEDVDLWLRFYENGFSGYNLQEDLYVVLEDNNTYKRRKIQNRLKSAKIRSKKFKQLGYSFFIYIKPYFAVLKSFVPISIYKKIHIYLLKK